MLYPNTECTRAFDSSAPLQVLTNKIISYQNVSKNTHQNQGLFFIAAIIVATIILGGALAPLAFLRKRIKKQYFMNIGWRIYPL